jgi:predicted transcriptional regulator
MKELEDLTPAEKSILVIAYQTLNKSLSAHQPKQRILKKIINMNPKIKKKAFNSLVSNGFLRKHPTGRNVTYELTPKGLKAANQHIRENFNNS